MSYISAYAPQLREIVQCLLGGRPHDIALPYIPSPALKSPRPLSHLTLFRVGMEPFRRLPDHDLGLVVHLRPDAGSLGQRHGGPEANTNRLPPARGGSGSPARNRCCVSGRTAAAAAA